MLCCLLSAYSQGSDILRIILEEGKSDILHIYDHKVSKAYVYGTEENLILFLINEKYVNHQINKGIVYNFLFAENLHKTNTQWTKEQIMADSNKILILMEDSAAFQSIYKKSHPQAIDVPFENSTFQLGEINNLRVYVTSDKNDTIVFTYTKNIVKIDLEENKSDIFQINGKTVAKVSLYGTKEDIIRFLINDKYIKHRMEEGTNYVFVSSNDYPDYFKRGEQEKSNKILIVIQDNNEFISLYNKVPEAYRNNEDKNSLAFKLEDLHNIKILVMPKKE